MIECQWSIAYQCVNDKNIRRAYISIIESSVHFCVFSHSALVSDPLLAFKLSRLSVYIIPNCFTGLRL